MANKIACPPNSVVVWYSLFSQLKPIMYCPILRFDLYATGGRYEVGVSSSFSIKADLITGERKPKVTLVGVEVRDIKRPRFGAFDVRADNQMSDRGPILHIRQCGGATRKPAPIDVCC